METTAVFESTALFLLLMTSATSVYLALSLVHASRHDRLGVHAAAGAAGPHPLLRDVTRWHWVPKWVVQWQLRHADRTAHETHPWASHLRKQLMRAGYDETHAPVVFRLVQVSAIALGAASGFLFAYSSGQSPLIYSVVGTSIGYLLPEYILRRRVRLRQLKILRELPAVLDLMVVVLEAGLSIDEALRIAGHETAQLGSSLGAELGTAAAEMRAGRSLDEALQNLAERCGTDDVRSLMALLIQSEKIGGRLGPALRASGELLTFNRRQRAEEAAQKSAIKMLIPLVALILPAMMIIILGPAAIQILQVLSSGGK
ncbi:MAG TPA: type II secretion system F family protein [Candidatus Acidoferrales bacterium]|nr:type II secretion system F family protein [Candidatus Acidoferrales bacterium]